MTRNCMKCDFYPCAQIKLLNEFMKENFMNLRIAIHGCRNDLGIKMSNDGSVCED